MWPYSVLCVVEVLQHGGMRECRQHQIAKVPEGVRDESHVRHSRPRASECSALPWKMLKWFNQNHTIWPR